MDDHKSDSISRRAYEIWESEGRPHGRHDEHWHTAKRELDEAAPQDGGQTTEASDPHPGMMGDGTEEQNLGQPGNPAARITAEEVEEAFADKTA